MSLQIGIVGLPNVGKSTLFNALIRNKAADAQNYPFCTVDPNVGIVEVPDVRLQSISDIVNPAKVIPTTIEFVDIAGLVKGASKGEGLGNQFLSHIREVDAICEVVRVFEDGNITHVDGSVDGKRDIDTIETELILADLETLNKRIEKNKTAVKSGDKDAKLLLSVAEPIKEALEQGKLASSVELAPELEVARKQLQLLTAKPILYVYNVSEDQLGTDLNLVGAQHAAPVQVCAKIESELIDLSIEESKEFLNDLGVESSGLDQLIRKAYDALGLLTYFTAGPKEVRAWTVKKGATAPEAAGVIHSDFQKGFIRAETIAYQDFIDCGGEIGAKEKGKMRAEGKEYVVNDGDVLLFRFNV